MVSQENVALSLNGTAANSVAAGFPTGPQATSPIDHPLQTGYPSSMTVQAIIDQALALPLEERVLVAEALMESVGRSSQDGHPTENENRDDIDPAALAALQSKLPHLYSVANQAPPDVDHYHNDDWK